jgi:polysaccharide biosynthesis/export protein
MYQQVNSNKVTRMRQMSWVRACVFVSIAFSLVPVTAYGQQGTASMDSDMTSTQSAPENRTGRDSLVGRDSLTTSQIMGLMDTKPELAVDFKRLMASRLDQQGYQITEDSITDEMLFSQIASDAKLRDTITNWLRARGYLKESDLSKVTSDDRSSDDRSNEDMATSSRNPSAQGPTIAGRRTTDSDPDLLQQSSANRDLVPREDRFADDRYAYADDRLADDRLPLDNIDRTSLGSTQRIPSDLSLSQTPLRKDTDNPPEIISERDRKQSLSMKKPERSEPAEPEVLHQPAPYNLLSLRDLYTQVPGQSEKLKRFGADVFLTRGLPSKEMPIDLPIGPDYVVGPGDGLVISLWGGISQSFTRVVDREGRIVLPEAGSVVVAGLTLEHAETLVQKALTQQFKDARVTVSVAHLRTVRIYVVGDVQRPGAYDISSLSTPLNALYAAGGPTSVGSLRTVLHYRGKDLIRTVDLYDFLLHGIRQDVERLEPGDTILVPPAGPQVSVSGMVKRPAIYELKGESKLSEVLEDAGGVTVSAKTDRILIERVAANDHRETVSLPMLGASDPEAARKAIELFPVKDGDRVMVAPILPYSERAVYLEGHVVRPGKYPYRDELTVSDVIRSYQDLLPEPSEHGEIVRLMAPDFRPQTIDFVVSDVLTGGVSIPLRPFDTIRVLGRYESDAPKVMIRGEVRRPGSYALSQGMTAANLVRMAGGFKRSALRSRMASAWSVREAQ